MKFVIGGLFILHGFAHLVGFVVPWGLMKSDEMEYKTTLLGGLWDIGDGGIRAVGLIWLAAALAFVLAAIGVFSGASWWVGLSLAVALGSFILSILGWPDSRIGVIVNIVIIVYLVLGRGQGWLTF